MIKITLRNGYYYKGDILKETETHITIKDFKGNEVEINKLDISVKEVLEWNQTNLQRNI